MKREQAEQIARKHHLQVFNDKHASIAKWVIDAIMEAVAVEREACAAVAKHVLANGHPTVITANGVPVFEITVRDLRPNAALSGPHD